MGKRSSPPVRNNGFRTGGDAPPSPPVLQPAVIAPPITIDINPMPPKPLVMLISNRR